MPSSRKDIIYTTLLCLFAGALTSFAFSPYDVYPLAVLGPAVLLIIWRKAGPGRAFYSGYLFGLGLFGVGVNWIHISINLFGGVNFIGAMALTFLFVAFISLYPALVGYSSRRFFSRCSSFNYLVLIAPSVWVLGEWLRGWLFTGFPWLNLGYSQIDSPLGGLAVLTGVYGISWSLMFTAGAFAALFKTDRFQKGIVLTAALFLWGAGWLAEKHDWTRFQGSEISVALVQGSVPQQLKWNAEMQQVSLDLYKGLSGPYLGSDLIIWPETAIPMFYYPGAAIEKDLLEITHHGHTRLLTGLPYVDRKTDRYYNSIVMFNDKVSYYHKRHLVPFGEYLPFKSLLGNLLKFLQIPMSDFSAGTAARPLLEDDKFAIGVSICYEDTFGEEMIESLPDAEILVNVSNDAWFGDSAAPHQHLQMARMRALESGRYLLRATNNGISAIIDEKGEITGRSAQFIPAVLAGTARLYEGMTPYARLGNTPVITLALLLLLIPLVWNKTRNS